jgi:hypothetical protein
MHSALVALVPWWHYACCIQSFPLGFACTLPLSSTPHLRHLYVTHTTLFLAVIHYDLGLNLATSLHRCCIVVGLRRSTPVYHTSQTLLYILPTHFNPDHSWPPTHSVCVQSALTLVSAWLTNALVCTHTCTWLSVLALTWSTLACQHSLGECTRPVSARSTVNSRSTVGTRLANVLAWLALCLHLLALPGSSVTPPLIVG